MKKKAMSIYLNQIQEDFVKDRSLLLGVSPPEYIRQLIDKRIESYLLEESDTDLDIKHSISRKRDITER